MWTPPHGRGRSREKVLPPPAPLGFEWRVWGSRVTWRRAIGPGGAMTSCSAAAVVEWGGDTHTQFCSGSARPWTGGGSRAFR